MKIAFVLLMILAPIMAFAADSEIDIFDAAQKSHINKQNKLDTLWQQGTTGYPNLMKESLKAEIIADKIERIIFIHKLNNEPKIVRMSNYNDWLHPYFKLPQAQLEIIEKSYPEYRELVKALKAQELHIKNIEGQMKSEDKEFFYRNQEAVDKISREFYEEQTILKKRWEVLKK